MAYQRTAWYRAESQRIRREVADVVGAQFLHLNLSDLDGSWTGYRDGAAVAIRAGARLANYTALDYFRVWLHDEVGENLAERYLDTTVRVDLNRVAGQLRLTGPITVKRLIDNGWSPEDAWRSAMLKTVNAAQGTVHDYGQQTLTQTLAGHTQVLQGWRRIVAPTACLFCRALTRTVWRPTDKWVKPHPKCGCTAEPVPNSLRVRPIRSAREQAVNQALADTIRRRKERERDELRAKREAKRDAELLALWAEDEGTPLAG